MRGVNGYLKFVVYAALSVVAALAVTAYALASGSNASGVEPASAELQAAQTAAARQAQAPAAVKQPAAAPTATTAAQQPAGLRAAGLPAATSGDGSAVIPLSQTMGDMHGGGAAMPAAAGTAAAAGTPAAAGAAGGTPAAGGSPSPAGYLPTVSFTLKTNIAEGRLVFVGVGGQIDGKSNPTLQVKDGDIVQITLINDDGATHDLVAPDFNASTAQVSGKGASSSTVFRADKSGEHPYFCSLPGHRQAGMEGKLVVGQGGAPQTASVPSIARDPSDLPGPIGSRGPQTVRAALETIEMEGKLADNTTYTYWTFNGKVPGPMIRARVGDTVEISLKNNPGSKMIHSIDLHAVTGPGGGATVMQVPPGAEKSFTFKALNPGLYVYHCATPMVAEHISSGMYGLILIEPEAGLPKVDREFYVMQGEIYTQKAFGQPGRQEFDVQKLLDERADYFVLNGAVGALTTEHPLKAKTGETVRIYFGDGGPNYTSSFHVIGEIFDKVYNQASLTSAPLTDVQTTLVPAGGATVVEFKLQVPGRYILVDHSLSRMERGLVGYLQVDGEAAPDIYSAGGK